MGSRMRMIFPHPRKRTAQNPEEVTFKCSKELKLKEFVRERSNSNVTPCLFEMSLVLSCLKETNFQEGLCPDELKKLNDCWRAAVQETKRIRERRNNIATKMIGSNLLSSEVNEMFKKYR